MVWAAFSAKGKTKIAFLNGRQNSELYIFTVSEFLLPFDHLHYGTEFVYQQDGASIHAFKALHGVSGRGRSRGTRMDATVS
ncbi:hypothetical protein Pcac1_g15663 [Phytophthora cactorum]|nr:hypothetical protein Pcac1_g15663 [Phytophthora cactorum]KAG2818876.1 hypothetical protein PC112_g12428 [Phytophthora cactorum]